MASFKNIENTASENATYAAYKKLNAQDVVVSWYIAKKTFSIREGYYSLIYDRSIESITLSTTPTPTPTFTSTPTPTQTITSTPTPTQTTTSTPTPTPTQTGTPAPTQTVTSTPTQTVTSTPTPTQTVTSTPTPTPTQTVTSTPTPTPTQTVTSTPTPTPTPTAAIGFCEFIWVADTVDGSRYGVRWNTLNEGLQQSTFDTLLGSGAYNFGGTDGRVWGICSTSTPQAWDSTTNELVDLGSDFTNLYQGDTCTESTCEFNPSNV